MSREISIAMSYILANTTNIQTTAITASWMWPT